MSFFSSQRGFDHSDFSRVSMSTLDSFDNLSPHPLQSVLQGSSPQDSNHAAQLADQTHTLPKVGQTRCYWALLTSNLNFVYTDPVLQSHLGEQVDVLTGKSLLTFVHPDEQTSARNDLGGVLESRTLHGSVTRVRFLRLSRVLRTLGHEGPGPDWQDAEKIVLDDNYMAVDIVINWAADGVVLCFIHAVVDISDRDNDEVNKTGWTNWCGTPYMSEQQVQLLHSRLMEHIPPPPSMDRVFQILLNEQDRPLWASWPPERQQVQGGPDAKDFAKLAGQVSIGNTSNATDAKTSCTRRYKAQQSMSYGNEGSRDVESIFIPYAHCAALGSIIFACHKVNPYSKSSSYSPHAAPQYYHESAYNLPPLHVPSPYHGYPPQASPSPYPSQNWSASSEDSTQPSYNQWTSQNGPMSSSPSISNMRTSTYGHTQQPQPQAQHHWSSNPPSYMESNGGAYPFPPASVPYSGTPPAPTPANDGSPAPVEDVVPASSRASNRRTSKESFTNGGRGSGNPPVGVPKCSSCGVTHSPEWRKGPSGKKDLCNACGLRYARSRAKKEGGTTRRRKDKVMNAMSNKSDHSPSASPVNMPFPPTPRRSGVYDDMQFLAGGQVPPSASDAFAAQQAHAELNGMKHSPSPTAQAAFAAYHPAPPEQHSSHPHDHRQHFAQHGFYGHLPSIELPHGSQGTTLPRLDAAMQLPTRLSPSMHSPASPAPQAHFSSTPYDHERRRDKGYESIALPPTPIAADGRVGGKY
ncbi:uncharacterized protein PHACADRAFT_182583 [Phanerochaete carnosa HHB-10118-sp]|uniref:GATA-type domain-containing protein n=1 Tax=Phanerochaete carnosa (strain HHB-10118-sp) TaxID=650164 RepID=K5V685_PHACS|nr:uncharacterized protein PHACADRAFT_182583 [Phanerochaete carnosa HHB-10118-sp]EKM58216.1 hypothetical protein PHACADRAFT_182583 [Phanerochaete carnosa HHB-10118-sp]